MNPYLIGVITGPIIGLVVGAVVAFFDPDGHLRRSRRAMTAAPTGPDPRTDAAVER